MSREQSVAQLLAGNMPERYLRNLGTIGIAGQLALLNARVAVVGAGGLGGLVIELLARQGVGHLTVVDGDCFACHNLNRQILATEHTLGMNKALTAVSRVAEINPEYKPWFEAIWSPPSAEVESFLFALQAAAGTGFIGYWIGFQRGRRSTRTA